MNKFKKFLSSLNSSQVFLIELIFLFFTVTFFYSIILIILEYANLAFENGHEFSILADSFLHGRFDLWKSPFTEMDCSMVNSKCYWGQGPFPAVILMPFVFLFNIFNLPFYQGYLQFFITAGIFFLSYKTAKKFYYSHFDSLWLAFAFCFASVYIGIAFNSLSWYFAQAVAVILLFSALYEYFTKKRYWLIGLYFAFIFATRLTAGLGILFFILIILTNKQIELKDKIKKLSIMLFPIFLSGLLLLYYNFVRFGNPFDNGYINALVGGDFLADIRNQYGLFNIQYFITNFYYYFFKLPEATLKHGYLLIPPYFRISPLGLSFFITSPIFIKMFRAKIKGKLVIFSWITSLLILFIILFYYNSGWWQFGNRYILDLLPFWFLIMLQGFKNHQLNVKHKLVITLSAFANFFMYISLSFSL